MKILIAIPSVFEADAIFKSACVKARLGSVAKISENINAIITGVGCKASQDRLDCEIKNFSPDVVLLLGYCGACNDSLKNSDFVYETTCDTLAEIFENFGAKKAKIACVNKTADFAKKQELAKLNFDAVEMESDFFKQSAKANNTNFAHLRCVSDAKNSSIPTDIMNMSMNKNTGAINPLKMLSPKAFCKHPTILFNLIRFGIEIAPTQKIFAKKSVELVSILKKLH